MRCMQIVTFENGPFMVNTYLVYNEESKASFLINPGSGIQPILDKIERDRLGLQAIVNTHGHIDHVAGVCMVKERFNVPFYMNVRDMDLVESIPMQASMFGVKNPGIPAVDFDIPLNGTLSVAGFDVAVLHTPGHSKGSVSLRINDAVFTGDALFNFSIGRTDLPGGNYEELITSIREKLFTLPSDTRILPGHGPETIIGVEIEFNPFFS